MHTTRFVAASSWILAVSVLACGSKGGASSGGAGSANTSGVTGTKTLVALGDTDRASMCAWRAKIYGGYGVTHTCPRGDGTADTVTVPPDKDTCVTSFNAGLRADCTLSVAEYEIVERSNVACTPEAGYEDAYAKLFDCLTF